MRQSARIAETLEAIETHLADLKTKPALPAGVEHHEWHSSSTKAPEPVDVAGIVVEPGTNDARVRARVALVAITLAIKEALDNSEPVTGLEIKTLGDEYVYVQELIDLLGPTTENERRAAEAFGVTVTVVNF